MKSPVRAFVLTASFVVATISCSQPQAEAPPAAPPEAPAPATGGPDPTVVDAAHYTVDSENERMRIVRIAYGPGEESVMHYHPEGVAVFLTPAHGSFEMPDGTTQEIEAEAGQVVLMPAGQHKPRNLGDEPFEVIEIELKAGGGGTGDAEAEGGPDATVVDAGHYTVDSENERVRVVRIAYGPGEESVMHYHPEGVAVFLTAAHGSFEMPDGTTQEIEAEAGQVMLTPAGQHKPRNLGDEPFEVIQIELKD